MQVGVGVTGIIFNDSGSVLLMKRKGWHGAGKWAMPGGWMEKGEWPADAAVREIKEEVDLDVSVVENLGWTNDIHSEGVHDVCFHMLCHVLPSSKPDAERYRPRIMEHDKCEALMWATSEQLRELLARGELMLATENFVRSGGYARAVRVAAKVRRGR
jgi:mutator protein MutT